MRTSVLVVLLVVTVLVTDTDAKFWRKLGSAIRKVGPHLIRILGKRSAKDPCQPNDEQRVQETVLMQQLQEICPTLDIDPVAGLTEEIVDNAFQISDEDENGSLNDEELEFYENLIDTYQKCVDMELGKRK